MKKKPLRLTRGTVRTLQSTELEKPAGGMMITSVFSYISRVSQLDLCGCEGC